MGGTRFCASCQYACRARLPVLLHGRNPAVGHAKQREQLLIPFWKQGSIFRPEHMAVGNRNVTLAMNVLLDIHEPVWPVPVRAAPLIIEERIPPFFPAETCFVVEVLIGHVGTEDREKAL